MTTEITNQELRNRLIAAAEDIRHGRIVTSEDMHRRIESRYPWLCE